MQVAKGLVVDRHRRKAIEQAYLDAIAAHAAVIVPSPEERLLAFEALVLIDSALNKLKPRIRETFILSQFEGQTYSEIALKLGVSVASVKKYMFDAMEACLDVLESGGRRR
jgi:RNA polymerase sigma factor (sigma-70 family)